MRQLRLDRWQVASSRVTRRPHRVRSLIDLRNQPFEKAHIPVCSLATGLCAARRGLPASILHDDARRSFLLQLETQQAFGFDSSPFYFHATYGTWEPCNGAAHPSSELCGEPTMPHYPVCEEEDAQRLELPDVSSAGMLPTAMRFSELQRERGEAVSIALGGVFTIAANICGMERLFPWMIEKPELVHRLLDASCEHLFDVVRHWCERFGCENVTPVIWEGMTNSLLLSPRHFREFVLPHQRELHRRILDLGVAGLLCHVCGPQQGRLAFWSEIPMGPRGIFSVGAEVDLTEASSVFRDTILMGNIDPMLLRDASRTPFARPSHTVSTRPGGIRRVSYWRRVANCR